MAIDPKLKKLSTGKQNLCGKHLPPVLIGLRFNLQKPTRPPLPPPEDSFDPYEMKRAFRRAHRSFCINGRSRMDVETFLKVTRGSVANLMTKELQDLDSAKVQITPWIQFKVEVDDGDGDIVRVDMVKKVFNSQMTEVLQESDLGEIIEEMFTHMKTQVKNPALANSRFVFD